jgi:(2R)-3-sulfolactate dehydrogenase (NADP+)
MPELQALVARQLQAAGANAVMAQHTSLALVMAEAQGQAGHGLGRVAQYCTHLRNGRANGAAVPQVLRQRGGAILVDAQEGLAFGACAFAVQEAIAAAREFGISLVGIIRSHHCGVLGDHLRPVAQAGLVGLGFANSPAAMPAAGGKHPVFGTNPVAAIFPRAQGEALMIDMSLSEVARGKLMVAAKEGRSIPAGWALDTHGHATTDPQVGMAGSMLPVGAATSQKGAMLALVVELLVTALIGGKFGFEASSFFVDDGNRPGIGQAFMVIDPGALAGSSSYLARVEVLIEEMQQDAGVRLPGARREALLHQASEQGVEVSEPLLALWRQA